MAFNINNETIKINIDKDCFGLEREGLRTTTDGYLARTAHPFNDTHIDRDFCENQVEIITGVYQGAESALDGLSSLTRTVATTLNKMESGREILWPFSNPPYVKSEVDIDIANYTGALSNKTQYREYLAGKYGKKLMLYSGIHYNYSIAEETLREACPDDQNYRQFKDNMYLNLAKHLIKLSWLIVYLTAASPVIDMSFAKESGKGTTHVTSYASPRCGKDGYWNEFVPILDCSTLKTYVNSIESYVNDGQLIAPAELYYPIRLKPAGDNSLINLKNTGVDHIEIRVLDVNPLSQAGIKLEDIQFVHILILYLISLGETSFSQSEQVSAIKNIKEAAKLDDDAIAIETGWYEEKPIKTAALEILDSINSFYNKLGQPYGQECIQYQRAKVLEAGKRYSDMVIDQFGSDYVEKGIELGAKYLAEMINNN